MHIIRGTGVGDQEARLAFHYLVSSATVCIDDQKVGAAREEQGQDFFLTKKNIQIINNIDLTKSDYLDYNNYEKLCILGQGSGSTSRENKTKIKKSFSTMSDVSLALMTSGNTASGIYLEAIRESNE